jgi:hypothetical protein
MYNIHVKYYLTALENLLMLAETCKGVFIYFYIKLVTLDGITIHVSITYIFIVNVHLKIETVCCSKMLVSTYQTTKLSLCLKLHHS